MNPQGDPEGRRSIQLLEVHLLKGDAGSAAGLFEWTKEEARRAGFHFQWTAALEHWSELVRLGVIATIGNNPHGGITQGQPFYVLTKRGRAILERAEASPHHTDRYLAALARRVGTPDPIAFSYVEEAVAAWKGGLYRASAVMLGCACERLILVLADHLRCVDVPPFSEKLTKLMGSGKPINISDVFTLVLDALRAAAEDKRLPGELPREVVDRRFTPIFERARRLRNTSGHPSGDSVHAEDAEAGLLLFPDFHEFAARVLGDLKPRP